MLVEEGDLRLRPLQLAGNLLILGLKGAEVALAVEDRHLELLVLFGKLLVLGLGLDCTGDRLLQSSLEIGQLTD